MKPFITCFLKRSLPFSEQANPEKRVRDALKRSIRLSELVMSPLAIFLVQRQISQIVAVFVVLIVRAVTTIEEKGINSFIVRDKTGSLIGPND